MDAEIEARNAWLLTAWRLKWRACDQDRIDAWPPVSRAYLDRRLAQQRLAARQFLKALRTRRLVRLHPRPKFQVPYGQEWV